MKKGSFLISSPISLFMIKIGIGGSEGINRESSSIIINGKGKIEFNGCAKFGEGIKIRIDNGKISFGNNFISNKNYFFASNAIIEFRDNVLLGWNINIRDSDGHYLIHNGIKKEKEEKIKIGNHVWICSYCDILKGVIIQDNTIIAYRSLVTEQNFESNCLLGEVPAKVIKERVNWEK